MVHSEADAIRVEAAAEALYSEDVASLDEATLLMVFADAPSSVIARSALGAGDLDPVEVIADLGSCHLAPKEGPPSNKVGCTSTTDARTR